MIKDKDNKSEKKSKPSDSAKVADVKKTNVSKNKPEFIVAKLNFLRMSPKKVRLVTNAMIGKKASFASDYLKLMKQNAAKPIMKLIDSAIANAVNNFELEKNNLYIKNILVNQGPVLKRWMPKAHGRATRIRKPSSHVKVMLVEKMVELGIANKKNPKSTAEKNNF